MLNNLTKPACTIAVVTNYDFSRTSGKIAV